MENLSIVVGTQIKWSSWSHCESSFSMLLVPHRPGVLALAEEVMDSTGSGKRMLALFFIVEAPDLSATISAMFAPDSQLRSRLERGRCYVRYAMICDAEHRKTVCTALEIWMKASAELASGVVQHGVEPASSGIERRGIAMEPNSDCDPADCTQLPKVRARSEDEGNSAVTRAFPAGF